MSEKIKTYLSGLRNSIKPLLRNTSKNILLLSLICVIIVICLGVGLGLQKDKVLPSNPWSPSLYLTKPDNRLNFLANLDGKAYISISQHGYTTESQASYFPLYPLVIYLVNIIIHTPLYSALVVSWASLVGAVYFYIKIIKDYFKISDNIEALKGVALFLLYPTGVFLIASYTESLFGFLSLGAIFFALKKKYLLTGLFTLFVTATHINGLLILLLVLMILYEEHEKLINIVKTFFLGIIGIGSFMLFLKIKYNNALDFITQQRLVHGWFEQSILPKLLHINPLEYLFVALILLTTIYWWHRRKSFAIYSLIYLLIPVVGGTFGGFTRYTLMIFPLQFMIFDVLRNKSFGYALCLSSFAIGWGFFVLQFAGGFI